MDELKDKLKSISLKNPFKKQQSAFKGTGHVLGSSSVEPARSAAGGSSAAGGISRPAQQPVQQPQQQKARPAAAAPLGGGYPSAAASSTVQSSAGRQPGSLVASQPVPRPATAEPTTASGTSEPVEPPSPSSQEALEASAAQLASDPLSTAAAATLYRLLRNVAASPADPKFRRLRLSNPKIREVVDAHGGVELLLACGFEIHFEEPQGGEGEAEGSAVLDSAADLRPLHHALTLLQPLAGTSGAQPPPTQQQQQQQHMPPANNGNSAALPSLQSGGAQGTIQAAQPGGAQLPQRAKQPRSFDPPRARATQVLLPQSPASDLPGWFFSRTGAELKAAFLSATRKQEQEQVLMTRAMRERLKGPAPAAPAHAVIKVRLPEGICLQGEFNPGEPVAAVFAWVSDSLRNPGCTYELVLPSRKPLAVAGQAVRDVPDLMPAVTLNFRWTGQSAADMQTTPALRDDLLRAAQAPELGC